MDQVTLAICTYNNAEILEKALASVERQWPCSGAWSLMVVDNNSTDATAAVVERYVERGGIPGLRRIVERKQGVAFARRTAILQADSEWVAFMDDDCLLAENWVGEAIAFCEQHPRAGAVGGRVHLRWEVSPDPLTQRHASGYAHQDYGDAPRELAREQHLVGPGLLLRRRAVLESGWPEKMILVSRQGKRLTTGEDTEIIFRIRNAGHELWYDPALLVHHCISQRRMNEQYLCRLYRGCGQSRSICKSLQFNRQDTLAWRARLFWDHLRMFARVSREYLHYRLLSPASLSPDYRIQLHFRLGQMEGALRFLWKGYRP